MKQLVPVPCVEQRTIWESIKDDFEMFRELLRRPEYWMEITH
jgi:hypothetical protein